MTNNIHQLFTEAYTLQHEGKLEAAILCYQKILEQQAYHVDSLHFLGLAFAQLGSYDSAIFYLDQAHKQDSEDPAIINNLANVYKKKGQFKLAIENYTQALLLKPNYAQAHNNLATIYADQNNYEYALQHYAKAVQAEPGFSAAHYNLGILFLKNNNIDNALIQFNNVIRLNPQHLEAQFYLGVLYLEKAKLDLAEEAFKNVLDLDSEHAEAWCNLGVIALKQNHQQHAIDYFSKALTFDNEHLEARNNLASTFMHHDLYENALMHYDLLLKREPNNIEYLYNSGVAQMALGHLKQAIGLFDHLLTQNSNYAPALNNLAAIYLKMDQRETARNYLSKAIECDPQDHISQHMLNALAGKKNASTNPEYAQNLFNNYALYYEQHMNKTLSYSVPQHINRQLHQLKFLPTAMALDLGCGTGLMGIIIQEHCKHLVGVDIAQKMIAEAEKKQVYHKLFVQDISEFLVQDHHTYDLIVAADVFPYFGSLDTIISLIAERLQYNGYFIFTIEINQFESWRLQDTARFSHHPDYLATLARTNRFKIITQNKIMARLQNHQPLDVLLYVFKKEALIQNQLDVSAL